MIRMMANIPIGRRLTFFLSLLFFLAYFHHSMAVAGKRGESVESNNPILGTNGVLETAVTKEQRPLSPPSALRRRAVSSLDTSKSVKSRMLQQGLETDIWLTVVNIPGQQPEIYNGPTGSNLVNDTILSSVYVGTASTSPSTLGIAVNLNFRKSSADVSATVSLLAFLTTPESNGAAVWEVQIELPIQIQSSGAVSASATGGVLYVYGNTGKIIPFEQYDASGKNELSVDGGSPMGSSSNLPLNCVNTTLEKDCRVSASLSYVVSDHTTVTLQAFFEHALIPISPTSSPKLFARSASPGLTRSPLPSPSSSPTTAPTRLPTTSPSSSPTPSPSSSPTPSPSSSPTTVPTSSPTPPPPSLSSKPTPLPTSTATPKPAVQCLKKGKKCKKGGNCCSHKCKRNKCK